MKKLIIALLLFTVACKKSNDVASGMLIIENHQAGITITSVKINGSVSTTHFPGTAIAPTQCTVEVNMTGSGSHVLVTTFNKAGNRSQFWAQNGTFTTSMTDGYLDIEIAY